MNRLKVSLTAAVIALSCLLLASGIYTGKVLVDGLKRNTTMVAFISANRALKQGDFLRAGRSLLNGAQMAVEGGLRWQAASYLLERTHRLQAEGQTTEATRTCMEASATLGRYDNNNNVYQQCIELVWPSPNY